MAKTVGTLNSDLSIANGEYIRVNSGGTAWESGTPSVVGEAASWLSANQLNYGSVSLGMYSGITYLEYPDTGNNEGGGITRVPTGKTGISSIKIYYLNESLSTNINISSRVYILDAATAITFNADTTATTRNYATTAFNRIEAITLNADVTDDLSAFSAGQICSVEIKRNANEAGDTYGAILKVLGVLISWS